jgi:broad specificity phosphatase PhoE
MLAAQGIERLIASPYTRALETATIIGRELGLAIEVEALVRERAAFHCDIGAPPAELARRFPELAFDHLDDPWWHDHVGLGIDESEMAVIARGRQFRDRAARFDRRERVCVVTHWGFIRALTGIEARNGEIVRLEFED